MRCLSSCVVLLTAVVSSAATINGKISDTSGNGVAAPEVRLWARAGKGFSFSAGAGQVVSAASNGNYSFTGVPAGDYLVDTRPSAGFGDRWYDTGGNGYVAADADLITV